MPKMIEAERQKLVDQRPDRTMSWEEFGQYVSCMEKA